MLFRPGTDEYIMKNERRVVRVRHHWIELAKVISQCVAIILLLMGFNWLLSHIGHSVYVLMTIVWWMEIGTLCYLGYHMLEWYTTVLIVTDKRFMRLGGVFKIKNDMMPISKVTDMTQENPLLGRVLGYGTLRIESAGQMQSLEFLRYIPKVKRVFLAVTTLVFDELGQPRKLPSGNPGRKIRASDQTQELPALDDEQSYWPSED